MKIFHYLEVWIQEAKNHVNMTANQVNFINLNVLVEELISASHINIILNVCKTKVEKEEEKSLMMMLF